MIVENFLIKPCPHGD